MQVASRSTRKVESSLQEITRSFSIDAADQSALQAGSLLHLTLKKIAQEQKIDGFAAECWSGFPRELGLNPCLGFIEDAYTLAVKATCCCASRCWLPDISAAPPPTPATCMTWTWRAS